MSSVQDLIGEAIKDARQLTAGIIIYIDPNVGGLSYVTADRTDSGPIGYDADAYDEGDMDAVVDALRSAGYNVAR